MPEAPTDAKQDELAETQIPDPGYSGTNSEIELESWEYDLYDFWDDLEYADDPYWDYGATPPRSEREAGSAGKKRKRADAKRAATADKRRKVSSGRVGRDGNDDGALQDTQMDPVKLVSQAERIRIATKRPSVPKSREAVAFLPDWRVRYANVAGHSTVDSMPAAMRAAAQGTDNGTPEQPKQPPITSKVADGASDGEEDDEWEDEAEEGDGDAEVDISDALPALDPDMLKQILREKLGAAGLGDMDESAFMATLSKMLAGDEDEAAGDLANTLLGQATGDGGSSSALNDWLSGQGVSLDADEDDDAPSRATPEPFSGTAGPASKPTAAADASSPDNGTAGIGSSQRSQKMVMHPGSPTTKQKDASSGGKKKPNKKVAFDMPPSQDSEAHEDGDGAEDTVKKDSGEVEVDDKATSASRATRSKAAKPAASTTNGASSRSRTKASDNQLQKELQDTTQTATGKASMASAPSERQTRKRKAETEVMDQNEEGGSAGGNRAVKEPATRTTRGARAKAGGK